MFKTFLFFLLALGGLLVISYFLQPIKNGKGLDSSIKYEFVKNWLRLPTGVKLGNPTGMGIDTNQNIVVFHRADRQWPLFGSMPESPIKSKVIFIIDKDNGKLIENWGENYFIMPHGLTVDNENNIWITDVGRHQVFKFSHNGKLLMKWGEEKVAGNDSLHFNQPTDIAVAKDGTFYVSDGYGNSRIVKFSPAGKYLLEWGKEGGRQGEFKIPHAISLDSNGKVYVADRENNRVQVFDPFGKFIRQFADNSFGSICAVTFDKRGSKLFAVDDLTFLKVKHRGSDVFIMDTTGSIRARFGRSGSYNGAIAWYHDLVVDKDENIYIGDILGNTIQKFKKTSSY